MVVNAATATLSTVAHMLAAHIVATMQTRAKKIANEIISYYHALFHMHSLVRESMCWWLALARNKMWWWIASFGYSYHNDVLQYAKQLVSLRLQQMTKYCIIRECENIHSWISLSGDLAFIHQDGIYALNSPKGFWRSLTEISLLLLFVASFPYADYQSFGSDAPFFAFIWQNVIQAVRHSHSV
jgi:hypothetical protein